MRCLYFFPYPFVALQVSFCVRLLGIVGRVVCSERDTTQGILTERGGWFNFSNFNVTQFIEQHIKS